MNKMVKQAKELAYRAHAGQTDKAGRPYIEHVARVAAMVKSWPAAEVVAWLHDVAEDHPEFRPEIEAFPWWVNWAVDLLDRNMASNIDEYHDRASHITLTRFVKRADIRDNENPERLALLDDKTAARLRRKYARAREVLGVED